MMLLNCLSQQYLESYIKNRELIGIMGNYKIGFLVSKSTLIHSINEIIGYTERGGENIELRNSRQHLLMPSELPHREADI